jgi:hypothetical protein
MSWVGRQLPDFDRRVFTGSCQKLSSRIEHRWIDYCLVTYKGGTKRGGEDATGDIPQGDPAVANASDNRAAPVGEEDEHKPARHGQYARCHGSCGAKPVETAQSAAMERYESPSRRAF